MNPEARYFIGLMSGTSVDAIDAALISVNNGVLQLEATHSQTILPELRSRICSLFLPGNNEIDRLGELDVIMAKRYADTVNILLSSNNIPIERIEAIGSHGQTIRHRPNGATSQERFTLQIGDPNTIAALTGIVTVADFRRKDMALGGQGAPLAPAFHAFLAKARSTPCGILNIGGIANLSVIDEPLLGFDTGPGNALLDQWHCKHTGNRYDKDGAWATLGKINHALVDTLMEHDYFAKPAPKSTGKEEFTLEWLEHVLCNNLYQTLTAQDIQASLAALTARSIAECIHRFPSINDIYVCGGGIHNAHLMSQIEKALPHHVIQSTSALGLAPEWVEATAFAWLAKQTLDAAPGNLTSVTGASRPAILGGIYLP